MIEIIETTDDSAKQSTSPARLDEQNWPKGIQPLVSISCTVFNQKNYIRECIHGFLKQETTFPVEILIHDDASTDGTVDILMDYEAEYPSLIKVIYQNENQFSKGRMINEFNFKVARGRYIALCHGDDYWIDPLKLEKQVSVMKEYMVSICGHPAKEIDVEGNDRNRLAGFKVRSLATLNRTELIRNNGNMLPFGSIMFTREALQDMLNHMPPVAFHTGIQMLGALRGGLAIMPDVMSTYRVSVSSSTTEIMLGNAEKKLLTTIKRIRSIKHLKKMYGKRYYSSFHMLLAKQVFLYVPSSPLLSLKRLMTEILKGENSITTMRIILLIFWLGTKLTITQSLKLARYVK